MGWRAAVDGHNGGSGVCVSRPTGAESPCPGHKLKRRKSEKRLERSQSRAGQKRLKGDK